MKKIFVSVGLLVMLFSLVGWAPVSDQFFPPFPQPFPFFDITLLNRDPENAGTGAVNPLTGLPVSDPSVLKNPPALLSITNWPLSARPQAGLSYVSMVYELSIGDGESRFLSIFYGDLPPEVQAGTGEEGAEQKPTSLGPLRSGRLPYEPLQQSYSGFLVMASGWKGILDNLTDYNNFYGRDGNTITSSFVDVADLKRIASQANQTVDPEGMAVNLFENKAPAGGQAAPDFWFIYNVNDQAHWEFDPALGSYIRYQDQADGQTFVPISDRLNGETVTMENVVMLFADHRYCTPYAFDIELLYVDKGPALLFRDGKVYNIFWTTKNTTYERTTGRLRPIRFVDANGDPFPMKPGQTWVHLVPLFTRYWEAPDTDNLNRMLNNEDPGSGIWITRFYESLMVYDQEVCDRIR